MDTSSGSSLVNPPMSPRSPPTGLDLYGKRRQMVKVQVLEREIGLLQEELKSVEDLQPASGSCKELHDFIGAKSDPFVAINQETHKSNSFWKRFWGKFCSSLFWVCCSSGCLHCLQVRNCCKCTASFHLRWPSCCCSGKATCQNCCKCEEFACLHHACCCCCFKCSLPKCTKVNLCSNFAKNCGNTCCV